jgi:alpha-glucosidase
MLFGQKFHPLNFEYPRRISTRGGAVHLEGKSFSATVTCATITPACTRLRFDSSTVTDKQNYSDAVLESLRTGTAVTPTAKPIGFCTPHCAIAFGAGHFRITLASGGVLETDGQGFGFNGSQAIFNFKTGEASGFYGFGERTKRFNKSGDSLDHYNVDVIAVHAHHYERNDYDPGYVSIPFAIIRSGGICTGLYFDNPGRVIFDVGQIEPGRLIYQSTAGNNDLYIIEGPTLKDVVRHFTDLTGRAEVPPVWSLGHHQCRWGYKTAAEFRALRDNFRKFDIPVSALWYDIDYMDEYRVFTWDRVDVPQPEKLNRELKKAGIRAVAIVDPGVKLEPGYAIYESGMKENVFCKTASGREYVGRVWPGDTVFPDFTATHARDWWAGLLAKFVKSSALDGAWLDMNEPATGWSAPEDMLFDDGRTPHAAYHNQYGHYMAKASRQAFDRLDRNARPFLLTRSGFTGTQRYSAIWTGDNVSNWEHLRMSIPCTMNLGLSGIAFNGPDVGGFFGHTDEELITRWYQAGFLFPFLRNHSTNHTKEQEPWNFGPECLARIRNAVVTRYRLMPYLYQCFFAHHLTGDPILRPLLYDFEDRAFEDMDDQFMVGESILMAPIVESAAGAKSVVVGGIKRQHRYVTLPEGWWFDLTAGQWLAGGRTIAYAACLDEVPIFIRDGSIVPYFNGKLRNSEMEFDRIELHAFLRERPGRLTYFVEDGATRRYLKGEFNRASIAIDVAEREARVTIEEAGDFPVGTVQFAPVFYGGAATRVTVETRGRRNSRALKPATRRWIGLDVAVQA